VSAVLPLVSTVGEVAAICRCDESSIYRDIANGKLRVYTVGRSGKRITGQALAEYMGITDYQVAPLPGLSAVGDVSLRVVS